MSRIPRQPAPVSRGQCISRVLDRLDAVGRPGGRGWKARCPAHDDQHPSLDIDLSEDGKVLLCCRSAGCTTEEIVRRAGLEMRDLFPSERPTGHRTRTAKGRRPAADDERSWPIVATYDYVDREGDLVAQVVRKEPPASADTPKRLKSFSQRRPDGRNGWIWNVQGIDVPLYRWPQICDADADESIYLCEGEKDADNLHARGLRATTNIGGAKAWKQIYAEHLRGRRVVILEDNDEAGQRRTAKAGLDLTVTCADVRVLRLPNLPPKGDVSDWLGAGGTKEALLQLAAAAPKWAVDDLAVNSACQTNDGGEPVAAGIQQSPQKPFTEYVKTDMGAAELFRDRHGAMMRYCGEWKSWIEFDGRRWKRDVEALKARDLASHDARYTMPAMAAKLDDHSQRSEYLAFAAGRQSTAKVDATLRHAEHMLRIDASELNRDKHLFNVGNGTLNLETLELQPHNPADLITVLTPTKYDPAAQCPTWDRHVAVVTTDVDGNPRPELARYMQKLFAYSMLADLREKIFPILWGLADTGKTRTVEAIAHTLGEYARPVLQEVLVRSRRGGNTPEVADLYGVRFAHVSELDNDAELNERQIKMLVGADDEICAMRKYENSFRFRPTHILYLDCNHLPKFSGDESVAVKAKILPFQHVFVGKNKDKKIIDKLRAETSGILNWLVAGLRMYKDEGLEPPACVVEAVADWVAANDKLRGFAEACITTRPGARTPLRELHTVYTIWARRSGIQHPLAEREFGDAMAKKYGEPKKSNGVRGFRDIVITVNRMAYVDIRDNRDNPN
jgi:putative DNA primase/helicase